MDINVQLLPITRSPWVSGGVMKPRTRVRSLQPIALGIRGVMLSGIRGGVDTGSANLPTLQDSRGYPWG